MSTFYCKDLSWYEIVTLEENPDVIWDPVTDSFTIRDEANVTVDEREEISCSGFEYVTSNLHNEAIRTPMEWYEREIVVDVNDLDFDKERKDMWYRTGIRWQLDGGLIYSGNTNNRIAKCLEMMMIYADTVKKNVVLIIPKLGLVLQTKRFEQRTALCYINDMELGNEAIDFQENELIFVHYQLLQKLLHGECLLSILSERQFNNAIQSEQCYNNIILFRNDFYKQSSYIRKFKGEKPKFINEAEIYTNNHLLVGQDHGFKKHHVNIIRQRAAEDGRECFETNQGAKSISKMLPYNGSMTQIIDQVNKNTGWVRNIKVRKNDPRAGDFFSNMVHVYHPQIVKNNVFVNIGEFYEIEHNIAFEKDYKSASVICELDYHNFRPIAVYIQVKDTTKLLPEFLTTIRLNIIKRGGEVSFQHISVINDYLLLDDLKDLDRYDEWEIFTRVFKTSVESMEVIVGQLLNNMFNELNDDVHSKFEHLESCEREYKFSNSDNNCFKCYGNQIIIPFSWFANYKPKIIELELIDVNMETGLLKSMSNKVRVVTRDSLSGSIRCDATKQSKKVKTQLEYEMNNAIVVNHDMNVVTLPCGIIMPLESRVLHTHTCVQRYSELKKVAIIKIIRDDKCKYLCKVNGECLKALNVFRCVNKNCRRKFMNNVAARCCHA